MKDKEEAYNPLDDEKEMEAARKRLDNDTQSSGMDNLSNVPGYLEPASENYRETYLEEDLHYTPAINPVDAIDDPRSIIEDQWSSSKYQDIVYRDSGYNEYKSTREEDAVAGRNEQLGSEGLGLQLRALRGTHNIEVLTSDDGRTLEISGEKISGGSGVLGPFAIFVRMSDEDPGEGNPPIYEYSVLKGKIYGFPGHDSPDDVPENEWETISHGSTIYITVDCVYSAGEGPVSGGLISASTSAPTNTNPVIGENADYEILVGVIEFQDTDSNPDTDTVPVVLQHQFGDIFLYPDRLPFFEFWSQQQNIYTLPYHEAFDGVTMGTTTDHSLQFTVLNNAIEAGGPTVTSSVGRWDDIGVDQTYYRLTLIKGGNLLQTGGSFEESIIAVDGEPVTVLNKI